MDKMRIPVRYLANLLSAGNEQQVIESLKKQMAVRLWVRQQRVGDGRQRSRRRAGPLPRWVSRPRTLRDLQAHLVRPSRRGSWIPETHRETQTTVDPRTMYEKRGGRLRLQVVANSYRGSGKGNDGKGEAPVYASGWLLEYPGGGYKAQTEEQLKRARRSWGSIRGARRDEEVQKRPGAHPDDLCVPTPSSLTSDFTLEKDTTSMTLQEVKQPVHHQEHVRAERLPSRRFFEGRTPRPPAGHPLLPRLHGERGSCKGLPGEFPHKGDGEAAEELREEQEESLLAPHQCRLQNYR
ncbi:MAG: hypothetical protein HS130_12400 [Deltaproteobacteria bacterium]|nr:hypothetical protein [Deltaproteobacteria bacterium]